jgi:uncharacterized membrane protein
VTTKQAAVKVIMANNRARFFCAGSISPPVTSVVAANSP